ncbi:aminotransferase class IV [Aestuariibacter sp. A3R04]|uniref:aminotransferase class IV n=1 Tax=Aestuariibacter sp. A3R04 TaxID=2841571 RepID=UPI001C080A21|nr:aminotransferase class IV [Aestuariibacter sp. A3R04]MBU3022747.1 aminotransferase class IV [Aestuariibacter sp. A3R04]
MAVAFLNGEFLPLEKARISPMDRGFLFGDGIYEVVPTLATRPVGLRGHLERLDNGLCALGIHNPKSADQWETLIAELLRKNSEELVSHSVGVYIQVSRGTVMQRAHGFPDNIPPTVFAFAFATAAPPLPDRSKVTPFSVITEQDRRWQRCNIKSTSLLGNVLHFQQSKIAGKQEVILYNDKEQITEASACNVFAVVQGHIVTPPLDHQILPGITRDIVIKSLSRDGIAVEERPLTLAELKGADEVWLTSSSKEVAPVTYVDDKPIANGEVGAVWQQAIESFNRYKFDL